MAEKTPTAEQPYLAEDTTPTPWSEARERLADADTYWLATVRPDGLPHLVPVLGVWVDGALCFVASPTSRKPQTWRRAGIGTSASEARLPGGLRASSLAPLSMLTSLILHGPFGDRWSFGWHQLQSLCEIISTKPLRPVPLRLGHPALCGRGKVRVEWRLGSKRSAYLGRFLTVG